VKDSHLDSHIGIGRYLYYTRRSAILSCWTDPAVRRPHRRRTRQSGGSASGLDPTVSVVPGSSTSLSTDAYLSAASFLSSDRELRQQSVPELGQNRCSTILQVGISRSSFRKIHHRRFRRLDVLRQEHRCGTGPSGPRPGLVLERICVVDIRRHLGGRRAMPTRGGHPSRSDSRGRRWRREARRRPHRIPRRKSTRSGSAIRSSSCHLAGIAR